MSISDKIIAINIKKVCAIELLIQSDNTYIGYGCILTRKKKEINIETVFEFDSTVNNLAEIIPVKIPTCLIINGKGVIHRLLDSEQLHTGAVLQNILPNANVADFYTSQLNSTNGQALISIIRNTELEKYLNLFSNANVDIIDFYIGPKAIENITRILNNSKFIGAGFSIEVSNHQVANIIKQTDEELVSYSINNTTLSSKFILAYASAHHWIIEHKTQTEHTVVVANETEFRSKLLFRFFGWSILLISFFALLFNYFLLDYFNQKNKNYAAQYQESIGLITLLDSLNKEFQFNQQLIEESGFTKTTKFSFITDRICMVMPEEIVLNTFTINPPEQNIKEENTVQFQKNHIIINGLTFHTPALNTWIKDIKQYKWIKSIKVISFNQYDATGPGEFNLIIEFNEI